MNARQLQSNDLFTIAGAVYRFCEGAELPDGKMTVICVALEPENPAQPFRKFLIDPERADCFIERVLLQ